MPSSKDYFKDSFSSKIVASATLNSVGREVESADYVAKQLENQRRFVPHVDFLTASNFCRYGSAKQYYEDSYRYIYSEYPYDGSLKEKIEWELSGTYLDKYVFDNLYPRTTGYVKLGKTAGAASQVDDKGYINHDASTTKEGIFFKGGPHRSPNYNGTGTLALNFTGANVYKASTRQESNLEISGNYGITLEFWMSRSSFDIEAQSRKQVIFDVWNSSSWGNDDYGRFRVELSGGGPTDSLFQFFNVTLLSGTDGFSKARLSGAFLNETGIGVSSSTSLMGGWNHYAISLQNTGSAMECKLYRNGTLETTVTSGSTVRALTGAMIGQIGSLVAPVSGGGTLGTQADQFSGSLTSSIDELRFWKKARTGTEIGKYWFTQVGGGTNTDFSREGTGSAKYSPGNPVDLGVYYKFNEGIYNTSSTDTLDETVLDYSGRVSNGVWTGYAVGSRSTGSAIVESSASLAEFKDPILYSDHPIVSGTLETKKDEGEYYDFNNNSSIFHTLPGWIREDDLENNREVLLKLCQIIGSYFDTLQLQIDSLPRIKDNAYTSGSFKPYPFTNRLVESMGVKMEELFADASLLESLGSRDDLRNFNTKLDEIKNRIYQNVYNNLPVILKSKGTEKSFRNMLRCYGIDERLVKLNLYGNNTTHLIRNNFESSIIRKRYADFNAKNRIGATVCQQTASEDARNARSYLSSSTEMRYRGNTYQVEAIFPKPVGRTSRNYYFKDFLTASIFGAHEVGFGDADSFTWAGSDVANFQVQAITPKTGSTSAHFQLTGTAPCVIPTLTSSLFNDVYDNSRWNLSVRIKPITWPYANTVSGSGIVTGSASGSNYEVIFSGYNAISDTIQNEFTVTGTFSSGTARPSSTTAASYGYHFLTGSKRFFVGAHRTDFTGALREYSDAKISSLRCWMNYLDNETLRVHARDPSSFGTKNPYKNAYITESGSFTLDPHVVPDFANSVKQIPEMETLALHWDFETTTGSDAAGQFSVDDVSSGSAAESSSSYALSYGWLSPIADIKNTGKGYHFPASDTGSISREFVNVARQVPPDVLNSHNMIELVDSNDDVLFTRETRPISHYFAAEKSPYAILSDEIIKVFATIRDFNNLIGEPVNRYRMEYKQLEKLRELYFSRIKNDTIDFEKFVDYYRWADDSISKMVTQLFPASADFSKKLRTLVESHVLERNKYWTKYPTLEMRNYELETVAKSAGAVDLGVGASLPALPFSPPSQNTNCWWWKYLADRKDYISSGDAAVDADRQLIHSSTLSAYNRRYWNAPVLIKSQYPRAIRGGSNFESQKKLDYIENELRRPWSGGRKIQIPNSGGIQFKTVCYDIKKPNAKSRIDFALRDTAASDAFDDKSKGASLARFSLYSASVDEFKDNVLQGFISGSPPKPFVNFVKYARITNYHDDSYGIGEVPMQGPFTERHVGGRQVRHANINTASNDTIKTRAESVYMSFGGSGYLVQFTNGGLFASNQRYPNAIYYRDEYAKRPLNIRNIKWGTSSAVVGNYQNDYEILQTAGRSENNRFFVRNEGFTPATASSTFVSGIVDFAIPRNDLTGSGKSIIVQRFSAPGGPETMARGVMDIYAGEYSVYNTLNYRNLIVRNALHGWYKENAGQFGIDPTGAAGDGTVPADHATNANNYNTIAAYHKINRNSKIVGALSAYYDNDYEGTLSRSIDYDNWYIHRPIPRSANQYSWITASISGSFTDTFEYVSNFSIPSGSTSRTASMPSFISESVIGSAYGAECIQNYGHYSASVQGNSGLSNFIPNDFVGLNINIFEPLTSSTRFLGFPSTNNILAYLNSNIVEGTSEADTGKADVFNGIITHRNGVWGYPSWKQLRVGENPIARYQKNNNIISLYANGQLFSRKVPVVQSRDGTKDAGTVVKFLQPFKSRTNFSINKHVVTASLVEPPVTFKYKPLNTTIEHVNSLGKCVTLRHSFGNNLVAFANPQINNILGINEKEDANNQNYSRIRQLYDKSFVDAPRAILKKFSYKEVVYPRDVNTGIAEQRGRTSYAEVDGVGVNGYDRTVLNRRTFWRDNLSDRIRSTSSGAPMPLNSLGYADVGAANVWPIETMKQNQFCVATIVSSRSGELVRTPWNSAKSAIHGPMFFTSSDVSNTALIYGNATYPTASQMYHWPHVSAPIAENAPQWHTNLLAKKNPWFDSYEDYAQDIRSIAKNYTVIPEFRISKNIDYYINDHGGDFRESNNKFLSLDGASITSSATQTAGTSESEWPLNENFFKDYSNTDFQKYFGKFETDAALNKVTLKCNVVKKLLPYSGFYPMLRCMQLGSILSKSVGDHIGGVNWANGDIKTNNGSTDGVELSGALAIQSLMQPFFAPGIVYNTIKSGIAVDWPVYTGSLTAVISSSVDAGDTGIFYGSSLASGSNYRIPFESLFAFKDHIPVSSSNGESKIALITCEVGAEGVGGSTGNYGRLPFFDWDGQIRPTFEMATNNFFAEVPNFFLKNKSFTTITSKPENEFSTFISGNLYTMDVFLRMPNSGANRTVMFEGYGALGAGTAMEAGSDPGGRNNTQPLEWRGRWYGPNVLYTSSFWVGDSEGKYRVSQDPTTAPYTPPYFYGKSIATVKYVADGTEGGAGTLNKILSKATLSYSNPELENVFNRKITAAGTIVDNRTKPAFQTAMMVSSSLNLLGKTRLKQIEYNLNSTSEKSYIPVSAKDPSDSSFDAWVISPKFETPILNFAKDKWSCITAGSYEMPRGMWTGYGDFCTGSQGLFMGLEETYPALPTGNSQGTTGYTGSLVQTCGFKSKQMEQKVGEIADRKVISEALVAIPYLEYPITNPDSSYAKSIEEPIYDRYFFTLAGQDKHDSRRIYETTKQNVLNGNEPLAGLEFQPSGTVTQTSISDLVTKLDKYVVPPNMNYDLYEDIEPFIMYILDVEHTLDKQDLADIWQGVMPKISLTAEKDSAEVKHEMAPWEFFGGKRIPKDVKWMVFKIKRKAEINYFKMTADSSDDDRFKFNFKNNEGKTPDYSYNWPYDFFSLIELAQLETENEFKERRDSDNTSGECS